MQRVGDRLLFAASDLNDYVECKRLSELESLVARGAMARPEAEDDLTGDLVRRKGDEHERLYLEILLESFPGEVVEFGRSEPGVESYRLAEQRTIEAMKSGARVIYQATFFDGQFIGHADFLRRVEKPSDLGDYGYEVIDTKLGLSARPYYLVQICNYSEHLARLQGRMPEFGYIVLGDGTERRFRLRDYFAYYRHLKTTFLAFAETPVAQQLADVREYPFKRSHCGICSWNEACTQQREDDDHLSLVAWMRRDQIAKFQTAGITRVAELGSAGDQQRPPGMNSDTFVKLQRQARLQVQGRTSERPIYELLRHEPPMGFTMMPRPAPGDVFFDMEGDPLYEPGRGLEYLFGCWLPDDEEPFRAFWGLQRIQERTAFENFVDFIVERRKRYPEMHVYHYAPYEKVALRRLAQEHCTREDDVDDLLRGEVLVDLYAVVRQTLAISEDGYGLKKLERFYDLKRETDVRKGDDSIVMFERWLLEQDARILDDIKAYNRDDCRSTYELRQWLLARRDEAQAEFGIELPLRAPKDPDAPCHAEFDAGCKSCAERRDEEQRSELERALLEHVLAPQSEEEYRNMSDDRRSRYLLANLLAYHRREAKPAYWNYYDQCENVDELLEFYKEPIGGLRLREDIAPKKVLRSWVYTYEFPSQQHKMLPGDADDPRTQNKAGTILEISDDENLLELKTTASVERAREIKELIKPRPPHTGEQRKALGRIGRAYLDGSLAQRYPAALAMLTNALPRATGLSTLQPDRVDAASVSAVAAALSDSYLFVQGPPGSGKTTTGAAVIADLLAAGQRVGVTSTGHKAIHNLLHRVEAVVAERGGRFAGLYKHSKNTEGSKYESACATPFVESTDSNAAFEGGDYQLAGGTSWLFTRKELDVTFDYLFIDEAGQVSLADALALSTCARNVVLLGDPSQLSQVSQGRQPLHAGDSILQHLLGDDETVQPDCGVFLDLTYRMAPEVCAFISHAMYAGRLHGAPQTLGHRVTLGDAQLPGLMFASVEHDGNASSSEEEASEVVRQIARLLAHGTVVDSIPEASAGRERPISERDVIVVTPYNAQRRLISQKLRAAGIGSPVGTVDKFQGQEAAVVVYSMATSSGEHVPRDMEFLFERNRFNVAISRARAASVLVCSPRLLDTSCRTPEEMELVNLLCEYHERAVPSPL